MNTTTVVLIGGMKSKALVPALEQRYHVVYFPSGVQALSAIQAASVSVIVVDASTMRSSGVRVCRSLHNALTSHIPIIHILPDENTKIDDSPADIILSPPFTHRKLINRIERVLKTANDEIIHCGPFAVNITNRILVKPDREIPLTPKQTVLLAAFFQHPNKVLERKWLMKEVWDTDYVGDTRTLDVHIRWLRDAIEVDKRKPKFVTTVRGVGYRFVIDTDQTQ